MHVEEGGGATLSIKEIQTIEDQAIDAADMRDKQAADELNNDVLAITNGGSSGTKLERKSKGREGRSRSPKQ